MPDSPSGILRKTGIRNYVKRRKIIVDSVFIKLKTKCMFPLILQEQLLPFGMDVCVSADWIWIVDRWI